MYIYIYIYTTGSGRGGLFINKWAGGSNSFAGLVRDASPRPATAATDNQARSTAGYTNGTSVNRFG